MTKESFARKQRNQCGSMTEKPDTTQQFHKSQKSFNDLSIEDKVENIKQRITLFRMKYRDLWEKLSGY